MNFAYNDYLEIFLLTPLLALIFTVPAAIGIIRGIYRETGMGWLPVIDMALPIGDILYIGGILLLGTVSLASDYDYVPEISYDEVDVAYGPPSPNDDDDDDDYDDYYDDDSNFGGRQKNGT